MKKDADGVHPEVDAAIERPIRAIRRARLRALLIEFGGPKKLAEKTETVDTHLIAIDQGRRDVGDKLAQKIEEKTGKPIGWMDMPLDGGSSAADALAKEFDELPKDERERVLPILVSLIGQLRHFPGASINVSVFPPAPASPEPSVAPKQPLPEDR